MGVRHKQDSLIINTVEHLAIFRRPWNASPKTYTVPSNLHYLSSDDLCIFLEVLKTLRSQKFIIVLLYASLNLLYTFMNVTKRRNLKVLKTWINSNSKPRGSFYHFKWFEALLKAYNRKSNDPVCQAVGMNISIKLSF